MIAGDAVHPTQRTFRVLLSALAHPGRITPLEESHDAPAEIGGALAMAALTLLDRDVAVWVGPAAPDHVRAWLVRETGCRLAGAPRAADFALLLDAGDALPLERWNVGTAEDPERSATLLIATASLTGGPRVTLAGPGIASETTVAPVVPEGFWAQWALNEAQYPAGIDCFFFGRHDVVGLPRTAAERAS